MSSTYRANGPHTAMTDAVCVALGSRHLNRMAHGHLPCLSATTMANGRGKQPWQTRCKTLMKMPSRHLLEHFLPLGHTSRNLILNSKVNMLISGAQGRECFFGECFNINTTHWTIPNTLRNALQNILSSPIFLYLFGTLVALDPWRSMILKIRDPKPRRLH